MRFAVVIIAIVVLLVLLLNYSIWERDELVFGFLPYQLAYDGALSIVTALVWLFAVTACWPKEVDAGLPGEENRPTSRREDGR